jgi:hypothetical protein
VGSGGTACLDLDHPAILHRAEGHPELERRAAIVSAQIDTARAPGISYYGISHRRQIADFAGAIAKLGDLSEHPKTALGMVRLLERIYALSGVRDRMR